LNKTKSEVVGVEELHPYSPYTDLALEATAAIRGDAHAEITGVRMVEKKLEAGTVTRVDVLSPIGEHSVGKPMGRYITIDSPGLRRRNRDLQMAVGEILTNELASMFTLGSNGSALVVGLGNWKATPDALGPRVTEKLLVTRHVKDYVPADVAGGLRSVAALSPGVLGITGIETAEIISGVVQHIRPDVVICIDALAARSIDRIGTTVQVTDTGINPGSGIGNQRKALNQETIGVPVIAIGVPTVVHAATIAHDSMEALAAAYQQRGFLPMYQSPEERRKLLQEVLPPAVGDLVVTPKEVDDLIDDMAKVIAGSLNAVLHQSVTAKDLLKYIN